MHDRQAYLESQRSHFESVSALYYSARKGDKHRRLKRLIWEDFFKDKQYIKHRSIDVLDAMCGYGDQRALMEAVLGSDLNYSGFDYSETLVSIARERNPGSHIWVQDVTTFEGDQLYDLVMVIGGLHHVYRNLSEAAGRLAAAVKPGGHLFCFEPLDPNPVFSLVRSTIYSNNSLFDNETERAFRYQDLHGAFVTSGLRAVDAYFPGLLSYVLWYNPDAFPLLNVGSIRLVDGLFRLERRLFRTSVGKRFSFAVMSLYQRPQETGTYFNASQDL